MTVSPQGISIQSLYRSYRDNSLVVNRQYQRKLVWTVAEKQSLIDSILKDYPLPLFLLADKGLDDSGNQKLEVIDGMQRLNAIFSFIEQGFLIDGNCFDVEEFTRAKQAAAAGNFKLYGTETSRLSAPECANLLDYQLAVTIFPGEKDARITDVFNRINSGGRQLSDQERRQAGVLSPFAEVVRTLAAELRGDVSRETLLLSEMPEISIDTTRNSHGYSLQAEDIFWCYQGILRAGDLRESDDEQALADICASILTGGPVDASGEFLNKIYDREHSQFKEINSFLASYGKEKLVDHVKQVFSTLRSAIEEYSADRFAFRKLVYPKATSNAQKSPFYAVFMAFYELMFHEDLRLSNGKLTMESLNNLTDRISIGQKHIKARDRKENIKIVKGLVRDQFSKADVASLSHGPGLVLDFENSIRRSRTENARYEFKQGILRLDASREVDPRILDVVTETVCAIANCGPDADGFLYFGIADKPADAKRIETLDGIQPLEFDRVHIVGIDREATAMGVDLGRYVVKIENHLSNSELSEPLKTDVLAGLDTVTYRGFSVLRIRIPKQKAPAFVADECYLRMGTSTKKATGPQIATIAARFN